MDSLLAVGSRASALAQAQVREVLCAIRHYFPDLHFDCDIDIEGLAAAVVLQQRLGSVPPSLRVTDIIDPRFSAAQPVLAS